jgi:hypothetical protein
MKKGQKIAILIIMSLPLISFAQDHNDLLKEPYPYPSPYFPVKPSVIQKLQKSDSIMSRNLLYIPSRDGKPISRNLLFTPVKDGIPSVVLLQTKKPNCFNLY